MGACASRPKDLNTQEAPLPVEKAEEQIVPQDNNNEAEAIKEEEPLVDVSAPPAPEAPKPEEDSSKPEEVKSEAANEANDQEKKVAEDEVSKVPNEPAAAPKAEETN